MTYLILINKKISNLLKFISISFICICLIGLILYGRGLGGTSNLSPIELPVKTVNEQEMSKCKLNGYLPDFKCNSGATDSRVTQDNINSTICVSGYTATVRPNTDYTNSLKIQGIKDYGYTDTNLSDYEEDHIMPLELGGSPTDPQNLFPEPIQQAKEKDKVENYLHGKVCSGAILLLEAQREIVSDWHVIYVNASLGPPSPGYDTNESSSSNEAGVIKMSTTGICHAPSSAYYGETKSYTPYYTLQGCLNAGGHLPKN